MIIAITPAGALDFRDRYDFKGFKIVVEKSGATNVEIASALKDVATLEADGKHAWVSQEALRNWDGQRQPADWIVAFDAMIEKVKKYGFVSDDGLWVRGHLEHL
jgi:hypothetical protein